MAGDPRAVLMRDIFDDPDDDLPRLVLGDWLADHGDPRGEFIQIDVRLYAGVSDDAERGRLERRRREILARHALDWLGPLVDVASRWEFRRGFIHLEARAERLMEPPGRSAMTEPAFDWVEGVALVDCRRSHLLPTPGILLRRVTTLELWDCSLMGARFRPLWECPLVARLRTLRIQGGRLSTDALLDLAGCPYLSQLRALDLSGHAVPLLRAECLADSPALAGLRRLTLLGCAVEPEARDLLRARFGDRVRFDD